MEKLNDQSEINESVNQVEMIKNLNIGSENKAQLIAVLLGLKPGKDVELYKWTSSPEEFVDVVNEIGLVAVPKPIGPNSNINKIAEFSVAKNVEIAEELSQLNVNGNMDHIRYGQLMGYPESSIEGYISGNRYSGQIPEDIRNSPFQLVFSSENYHEEFEYVRNLNSALNKYAPELLENII